MQQANGNGRPHAGADEDEVEEPVEIQLTILWEVGLGTLVIFAGKVTAVKGNRLQVFDRTDDAAVDLGEMENSFFVGDLVEVVGRKMRDEAGPYIAADRVELIKR
jgi:hypothetical protein